MRLLRAIIGGFSFRRTPWALLAAGVLLGLVGVVFITSAHSWGFGKRHLQFLAMGIVAFLIAAIFDYRHLASLSIVLYAGGIAALGLLPFLGETRNYATRWYDVGPFLVQPSEPMKYIVVLALATYFRYRSRLDRLRDLAAPLLLVLVPMLLIVLQPDLGTSLLFLPAFFVVAFLAGVPVRNLALIMVAGVALAGAAWVTPRVVKDYQRDRVLSFLYPDQNRGSPAYYNAEQAARAIMDGGPWGQGWGEVRRTLLGQVPESHTDFIFPVIAEQWGFFRTAALVLFYLLLIVLMGSLVREAPDLFGGLLAGGVLTLFAFQSLLHMAISLRLTPITGLTLPLVSYGGSSLLSTMAGLGLVAGVGARRARPTVDEMIAQ